MRVKLPPFRRIDVNFDLEKIKEEYRSMEMAAREEGNIHCGRGNLILDLTYVSKEQSLPYPRVRYAGSSTERAVNHYQIDSKLQKSETRLNVFRQSDPFSDDRNHNAFKKYAMGSYTVKFLESLGEVSKVTFAMLEPNSWWPSHFDFSENHAAKINIPIESNEDAVSIMWDGRKKQLVEKVMKPGEVWQINPSLKHTAFNWGKTNRLFLLATYRNPGVFDERVYDAGF